MNFTLPPERVFKYRNAKWGVELLRSKTLYFNKPKSFKDSNDCNPDLMNFGDVSSSYIKEVVNKTSHNRKGRRGKIKEYTCNPRQFIEYCKKGFQGILERLRVSCFSKRPDNKRLWDEYADEGKGLCFCFNSRIEPEHLTVMECTYFDNLPKFNYFDYRLKEEEKRSLIMNFFSSKLKSEFEFEEEVRIFHFLGEENIKFKPILLEEVILGINVEKDTEERVLQLLKASEYSHVKVRKVLNYDDKSFVEL